MEYSNHTVDVTLMQCKTSTTRQPGRLDPPLLRFYSDWFEGGLPSAIDAGSLISVQWLVFRQEKLHPADRSGRLPLAKMIEAKWLAIEREHGEGAMLVEDSPTIALILSEADPESAFTRKPHLLENARKLRDLKGAEWWMREHQLDWLAAEAGFRTC